MTNVNNLAAALASIQQNSVGNAYSAYAPGTKLLNRLSFEEEQKQNEVSNSLEREKMQENIRQFNESLAEEKRSNDLSYSAKLASAAVSGGSRQDFSTQGERANDTKSTLMNMLSNQYRMLKDDPSNPSKTPLKDTMEWYSYVAREIAPDISEEDRQKVAFDYMSQLAARTGTSMSSKQMQDFVLRYAPSLVTNNQSSFSGVNFNDPNKFLKNSK